MKFQRVISALSLAVTMGSIAYGQAVPAGVVTVSPGNNLPSLDGILHYALSASEIVQLGYYGSGQVTSSAALSGDVAYTAKSATRPFSLIFAGGVLLPNQPGQGVSTYQNVAVSQGYVTRHWVFNIADSFSFLPESPTTGLSGIAGVGDLGAVPVQGPVAGPAGGVLTISGDRVGNALSGSVERQLSRETSISGLASWSLLHFLAEDQGAGLDSRQLSGTASINHRLDARDTVSVNAVYSAFDYTGPNAGPGTPTFLSKGINLVYSRTLSHAFSMSASVGPQWVSSSNSALIPSTLNVAAGATLSYSRRYTNASISYSRGVSAGSGALPGALSDSVSGGVGRSYGRNWVASLSAAYTHTSGLTQLAAVNPLGYTHEVFDTVYGGGQVSRRFTNYLSGYVSYTATHQVSSNSLAAQNALSGTFQTFGIGITFSPRSTRLGQF